MQIFENQSGEKSLDWAGRMVAGAAARRLAADLVLAPTVVGDVEGWRELGSGRVLSGTLRKDAKGLLVEGRLTDAATSRVIASFSEASDEAGLLGLSGRMAAMLGVKADSPIGEMAAWKGFALAQEARSLEAMEKFVAENAGFGPAYPVVVEMLKRAGRMNEAKAVAARLPADADALSKAQLAYSLAGDAPGRAAAAKGLIALRPTDVRLRAEVAGVSFAAGEWVQAREQFAALTKLEPTKTDWWNSLGYVNANLNRLPEAVAALTEYRRLLPNEPNALDSLGEVNFMNRNFKEAARYFDEAWQKYPAFQGGVEWRKAGFAYYLAGDLKTADARFDTWIKQAMGNAAPRARALQRAMWLARTGRWERAQEFLKAEAGKSAGELKTGLDLYLAMMRFGMEGARPTPATLAAFQLASQDPTLRTEISIFALLSQPAATAQVMESRIAAAVPQPQLAQLRGELTAAGRKIVAPVQQEKPAVYPPPNAADSGLDAMLLRSELAVLP